MTLEYPLLDSDMEFDEMSFNNSVSEDEFGITNSIAKYQGTFGAWFIICFFGVIVGIIIYPWYQLWKEKKDEQDQDALGSYYEAATIKHTFALRRNALKNPDKVQDKLVVDV